MLYIYFMCAIGGNINYKEKVTAIIVLFVAFILIPYRVIKSGFIPTDDVLRDVAFSQTDKNWSDVLIIEPGFETDHNPGWHQTLRALYKYLGMSKEKLVCFSVISLFLLINITGSLVSPNVIAWSVVLLIMLIFDRGIIFRFMLGRPYLVSCTVALILFKLWFDESEKTQNNYIKIIISIISLTLAVWLHGTWYTFLLLPIALLLAGKINKSIYLTLLIVFSTILGAYLTGHFNEFLYFHYANTLNIFSEKTYTWQLVSELAEGDIELYWFIPTLIIIILLVYSKKLKLNDLSQDPTFILILLAWLLSIKVARFWVDWGDIALMFWLSCKLSLLIADMQSIRKRFFRSFLFLLVVITVGIFIPSLRWKNSQEISYYYVDFSKPEFAQFMPEDGGIIYNDNMKHFYFNYYANPYSNYRYVLGFEPAILTKENKSIFRDISYNSFHFSAYKPWIDKLTKKDRIFTSVDISDYYPKLDWIKAGRYLYIGKVKEK